MKEFAPSLESLPVMLSYVLEHANNQLVSSSSLPKIELCLEEVLANIIEHGKATQPIKIQCREDKEFFFVEVEDKGKPFNPMDFIRKEGDRPGGYGIFLIREYAEQLHYERRDDTNVFQLGFSRKL